MRILSTRTLQGTPNAGVQVRLQFILNAWTTTRSFEKIFLHLASDTVQKFCYWIVSFGSREIIILYFLFNKYCEIICWFSNDRDRQRKTAFSPTFFIKLDRWNSLSPKCNKSAGNLYKCYAFDVSIVCTSPTMYSIHWVFRIKHKTIIRFPDNLVFGS